MKNLLLIALALVSVSAFANDHEKKMTDKEITAACEKEHHGDKEKVAACVKEHHAKK